MCVGKLMSSPPSLTSEKFFVDRMKEFWLNSLSAYHYYYDTLNISFFHFIPQYHF